MLLFHGDRCPVRGLRVYSGSVTLATGGEHTLARNGRRRESPGARCLAGLFSGIKTCIVEKKRTYGVGSLPEES